MVKRILTPTEATAIQTALNAHGAQLEVDGHFGELSHLALIRFQVMQNISPADGNLSGTTLEALGVPDLFNPPQPRKAYPMETVLANVKSAWMSKLNWTLAAGAIFNLLAFFGIAIPADVKDAVLLVGNGLVLIVAWVIRTWFTQSITAASAKNM